MVDDYKESQEIYNGDVGRFMFSERVIVSESQLEQSYGHLHHAEIMKLLERGRIGFLEARGVPYQANVERGLLMPIADMFVRFRREIVAGVLEVKCLTPIIKSRIIEIPQEIWVGEGDEAQLAVEAKVRCLWVCAKSRRAMVPSAEIMRALLS